MSEPKPLAECEKQDICCFCKKVYSEHRDYFNPWDESNKPQCKYSKAGFAASSFLYNPINLKDCLWEASVNQSLNHGYLMGECIWFEDQDTPTFDWVLETLDKLVKQSWWNRVMVISKRFDSPLAARADCEAFLERNGWRKFKWVN